MDFYLDCWLLRVKLWFSPSHNLTHYSLGLCFHSWSLLSVTLIRCCNGPLLSILSFPLSADFSASPGPVFPNYIYCCPGCLPCYFLLVHSSLVSWFCCIFRALIVFNKQFCMLVSILYFCDSTRLIIFSLKSQLKKENT